MAPTDPHSDPRARETLTPEQTRRLLYLDAAQCRHRAARLAALAATRPDLAPLIALISEGEHTRAGLMVVLAATPAAATPPRRNWWRRVREAWRVLIA
jgi:hypothetical protein